MAQVNDKIWLVGQTANEENRRRHGRVDSKPKAFSCPNEYPKLVLLKGARNRRDRVELEYDARCLGAPKSMD